MCCPRCGQRQATDSMRFCSRCGFPLEGTMIVLAHGGMLPQVMLPQVQIADEPKQISPRKKGVRQGALLMLAGAVLLPVMGVFNSYTGLPPEMVLALAAVICFLGGPLRILYAAVFQEGARKPQYVAPPSYVPPANLAAPRAAELPAPSANPATAWLTQRQTGEIGPRPSVTDHTTQLLGNPPKPTSLERDDQKS